MENFFFDLYKNKAHYLNVMQNVLIRRLNTFFNYIFAWWWSITLGHNCIFQGRTYFKRHSQGTIRIGNNCRFNSSKTSNLIGVYSPCIISALSKNAKIEIGDNCGFSGTVIGAAKYIKLGNNVRCGANTLITDTDWHTDDYRTGENKEVIIADNVWLGYGVKVLKGVHIGENSLIGANSVVTKDIPANVIAAGNPCKVIKQLN